MKNNWSVNGGKPQSCVSSAQLCLSAARCCSFHSTLPSRAKRSRHIKATGPKSGSDVRKSFSSPSSPGAAQIRWVSCSPPPLYSVTPTVTKKQSVCICGFVTVTVCTYMEPSPRCSRMKARCRQLYAFSTWTGQ